MNFRVGANSPSRRPDHVLGDVDGHEQLPVVDVEGQSDHLRRDHRAPRPGADHLLGARGDRAFSTFFWRLGSTKGPLLAANVPSTSSLAASRCTCPSGVLLPGLVALGGLAPRRAGVAAAPEERPSPPPIGMVDRVHGDAAHVGPHALPARAPGLADATGSRGRRFRPVRGWRMQSHVDHAVLAAGHPERGVADPRAPSAGRRAPGGPNQLGPLAGLHLDGVDHGTEGDGGRAACALPGPDLGALRPRLEACRPPPHRWGARM